MVQTSSVVEPWALNLPHPLERKPLSLYKSPNRGRPIVISGGLGRINSISRVVGGSIAIHSYPEVRFDPNKPFWPQVENHELHVTVRFYLHSLNWIDFIVDSLIRTPSAEWSKEQSAGAEFVLSTAKQWWELNCETPQWWTDEYVWGGHAAAIRAASLGVLSQVFPEDKWLYEAIQFHGQWLMENFDGYWNHGLSQALALLVVGDRIGNDTFVNTGTERAVACLEVMIDEEGAINEQAPEYANYIERLRSTTVKALELFGADGAEKLRAKRLPLEEFMVHSLTPSGTFVELGDSMPRRPNFVKRGPLEYHHSNGVTGAEVPRVKVYSAGYVFGRSGYGQSRPTSEETYYTLRFGPPRQIHGHLDHLSVTFWALGRDIITDAGHPGYTKGRLRTYAQSRLGHNVLTIRGKKHDPQSASKLLERQIEKNWAAFDLEDVSWQGISWKRSTCFADCGPFVVVDSLEPTPGIEYAEQRWNVAPEFEYVGSLYETVTFRSVVDGTKLVFIRYGIEGENVYEHTDVNMGKGDVNNLRGIIFRDEKPVDTWNIGFGRSSRNFCMLTAVIVAGANEKVEYTFKDVSPAGRILRLTRGTQKFFFQFDSTKKSVRAKAIPEPPGYLNGGLNPS